MRTRPVDNNPIGRIFTQIKSTQLELARQRNQKSPTVEIFDLPDNPPAIAIEGELVQDKAGKLWWYLEGQWRTC